MSNDSRQDEERRARLREGLEALGQFVVGFSWADQSSVVHDDLLRVLSDSLTVMIAGGRLAESARLRQRLPISDGPATVFGDQRTRGTLDAAWLNGVSLVSLELDEGNKRVRGHATAHVLPAVLAVAESRSISGEELATAFLVGHEVASRFGRAVVLHEGVHPHGNWGVTGAAAASARLFGLSAGNVAASIDTAGALALATPFRVATAGMAVRNAWIGHANVAGIQAAALAQESEPLVGIALDSLGHLLGVLNGDELTAGLGVDFAISGGYFKRHASCSYTHPPADAALALFVERGRVEPEMVESIEVESHHLASALRGCDWPTRMAAMFSIPYVVAVVLRTGQCGPESFDEAHRTNAEIAKLASKITVLVDRELDSKLPAHRAARLRVHWAGGEESVVEVENPIGDADFHPLSESDLFEKSAALLGDRGQAVLVRQLSEELLQSSDVTSILAQLRRCALEDGHREG